MDSTPDPLSINVSILGELSSLTHALIDLVKDIDLNARISRLSPQGQRVIIYKFVFLCNGFGVMLHLIECPSAVTWQAQKEFLYETRKRIKIDMIVAEISGDSMKQWITAMDMHILRDCCIICAQRQQEIMPGIMDVFNSFRDVRVIPAVLPGSILDQFEPTSVDQATAMITLFKIIIAQSYNSQDTTITRPRQRFVDFHNQLMHSLIDIFQGITSKINELSEEIFNVKLQISGLEAQIDEASRHITVATEELNSLDTMELVALDTTGESHAFHKAKMTKPTPDFTFALRTDFPIRAIVLDVSPSSKWEDSDVESRAIGTCAFFHKLKNSRLKDAFAYVRLLGWKRDLNESAIESAQAVIDYEKNVRKHHQAQLDLQESLLQDAIAMSEQYSARLHGYKVDISRLYDVQITGWQLSRMLPILEAQSLFGVAFALGLDSTMDPKFCPELYQRMRTEGTDCLEELCWSLESKMIDLKEIDQISSAVVGVVNEHPLLKEMALALRVEGNLTNPTMSNSDALTKDAFRDQAKVMAHDEELVEVCAKAHHDFDRMSILTEIFTNNGLSLLNSANLEIGNSEQAQDKAKATTEKALNETWNELNAAKDTMQLLDSPSIPIGLFTSLQRTNDIVDGCLDAWRCLKEIGDGWRRDRSVTRQTTDGDLDLLTTDETVNG